MRLLFIFVCVLNIRVAPAQDLAHFNITQQEGLPSNTVYDVFQDSKGFLWVATDNGVARYNGASFRRYANTQARSTAVSSLSEDHASRIWLHNFFGEILFVENDTLRKLQTWDEKYTEGFPSITNLGDSMLISHLQKLFYYSVKTNKWSEHTALNAGSTTYNHHLKDANGIQWVCYSTGDGTYVETLNKTPAQKFAYDGVKYPFNNNVVRLVTWQDSLWLFDQISQLFFAVNQTQAPKTPLHYKQALQHARQVQNIGDSLLALTGPNGAYVVDRHDKWLHLLSGKNVSCMTADREGGLWIGTLNEGLYYFPIPNSRSYPKQTSGLYTKLKKDTRGGRLFVGGYNGQVDIYTAEGKLLQSINAPVDKEVQTLFFDSLRNELYVFTNSLRRYNARSFALVETIPLAATKAICLVEDKLAFATSAGLFLYNPVTKEKQAIIGNQRITSVAYHRPSRILWVGSQKGVYRYSISSNTYALWQPTPSQPSPGVACLLVHNNSILIGTLTNGFYTVDSDEKVQHFSTAEGLSSNHITSLVSTGNAVWLGSDKGLSMVDLKSGSVSVIDKTKGMLAEEIYDLSLVGETLWVSHASGLQLFNKIPPLNNQKPIIHVSTISSNGQRISATQVSLPAGSRQLSFVFDVSNNLKSQGATTIYYRIKELDKRWNSTTLKNPVANYLSLPYGDYTFQAKAANEDGVESANLISLPIAIPTPFWRQAWFSIVVLVLLILLTAWLVYRWLQKTTNANKARMLQLTREQELRIAQLTSIRAQMNPHFIFNTMALIQGKISAGQSEEAGEQIHHFSSLIRNVLDLSSKEMVTLQEEIDILEKYLAIERDRFDGNLEYTIRQSEEVKSEFIRIPSLLTQPFVENALRHGLMHKSGIKKLTVDFSLNEYNLVISIDDNGIGRKASGELNKQRGPSHKSFATEAYQQRIDLLNASRTKHITLHIADKHTEYGTASGTTVLITIPLDDANHE